MKKNFCVFLCIWSIGINTCEITRDSNYGHLMKYQLPSAEVLIADFDACALLSFREKSLIIEKLAGQKENFMDVFTVLKQQIYEYTKKADNPNDVFNGASLFINKIEILKLIFKNHETALQEIEMAKALGSFKA